MRSLGDLFITAIDDPRAPIIEPAAPSSPPATPDRPAPPAATDNPPDPRPEPQEGPKPDDDRPRGAPFSIRLTQHERARLSEEAGDLPLGTYIRVKALGGPPPRQRRSGLALQDRSALAQALALLGRSRLTANLNQLAHAVNSWALPISAEAEGELRTTLAQLRTLRPLLLQALGLKPDNDDQARP